MILNKQLDRFIHIINKVERKPYISFDDLKKSFSEEISKNTLQRDIEAIKNSGILIQYDRSRNGYYIDNEVNYDLSTLWKFIDAYQTFTILENSNGFSDFVYPEKRRPSNVEHLNPFIDAIKKSQLVQFCYYKHSNRNEGFLITNPLHSKHVFKSLAGDEKSFRMVAPYVLKEFRGLWYLIGKDEKDGKIKTFGLDRISEIKLIGRKFEKDKKFNIKEKYRDTFGIYTPDENSQAEEIILAFDAENGKYLKANPLHHSQNILVDTANEFRISLHIHITLDFLQEILTRTWSLRVISPDSLRLRLSEIWEDALIRNKTKPTK